MTRFFSRAQQGRRICTFNHVNGMVVVDVERDLHTNFGCWARVWGQSLYADLVLGQQRFHPRDRIAMFPNTMTKPAPVITAVSS